MLTDQLEQQAALYASGALTALERLQFESILEFHGDLRALVDKLQEAAAKVLLATQENGRQPRVELKAQILHRLDHFTQQLREQSFVIAAPDGTVGWVNAAFSGMCGYTCEELAGRKLGSILQGPLTDPAAATRLREAVRERRPCTETLINYHKNGRPYWVAIIMTPIHNAEGELLWYVARELEITERAIPASPQCNAGS